MSAKSGVYCGPLKLLAVEVFNKSNTRGTPCDLVTGEDRKWASPEGEPSSHVSCTVEMSNISQTYEVRTLLRGYVIYLICHAMLLLGAIFF